jgi:hypothetical protein
MRTLKVLWKEKLWKSKPTFFTKSENRPTLVKTYDCNLGVIFTWTKRIKIYKYAIIEFFMIYYDIAIWGVKLFRCIVCNNYDGFFSTSQIHHISWWKISISLFERWMMKLSLGYRNSKTPEPINIFDESKKQWDYAMTWSIYLRDQRNKQWDYEVI